ncbi:uncharacterized protein [Vicugna pacos]|uniref:Uncharacterized protein n=1 Tax=Vicugna pacos TaxID=30538 RepID=A0ABM5CVG8_VICPA
MTFIFRIEIHSSIQPPEATIATSASVRGPQLPQRTGPSVQGMGSSSKHRQEAALRSHQEEERVSFTTWGKWVPITLCASALFLGASQLPAITNLNGRDPIQKYLTVQVGHAHHCFPHQFYHHRDPERHT